MFFSFKKNIAATFIVGTLLNICSHTQALTDRDVRLLRAAVVAPLTYYIAGGRQIKDESSKNPIDLICKGVRGTINFYNKNKDALHLTLALSGLAYLGLEAGLNSLRKTAEVAHFKAAPIVGAFVNLSGKTTTAAAATATTTLSADQLETLATLIANRLKSGS